MRTRSGNGGKNHPNGCVGREDKFLEEGERGVAGEGRKTVAKLRD